MSRTMEFGIIPVLRCQDGQLIVQPQILFPSEEEARRAAEIFAEVLGGAVAFSRIVDRETGLAEDGVIIGKYGVLDEIARADSCQQGHGRARAPVEDGPRLSLRENPERYILTFFEAQLRLCALARLSREDTPAAFAQIGEASDVISIEVAVQHDSDGHPQSPSIPAAIELLARQRRSLHEVDEACPDDRWFVKMTGAWAFTLAGTDAEAAWNGALACATEADERAFFDRVLAPWIAHRFRHTRASEPRVEEVMGETAESFGAAPLGAIRRLEHDRQGGRVLPR
ncbi:MAG: hypothetical protein JO172_15495 [Hyphomicrobiales bacterium]|nr:hypothetical protein [Hyphomicrobiales bacterium]